MKRCVRKIIPATIFIALFLPNLLFAEFTRDQNFEFAGEKRIAFVTPKKDKTWDVKLLNQSAGRIFFHFAGESSSNHKQKISEKEIGLIGYFGVAEGPGKGKYFVVSSDHIELTKLREVKEFYYEFEGI